MCVAYTHARARAGGGKKGSKKKRGDQGRGRDPLVLLGVEDWVYFAVPHHRDHALCEDTRTALLHCLAARLERARHRGRGPSSSSSSSSASALTVPGADAFLEAVCFALEQVETAMEHCAGEVR